MSKEKSESMDSPETAPVHVAGNRRAAKSRSGKPAKSTKAGDPPAQESAVEKSPLPYPVFDMAESGSSGDSSPDPSGAAEASPQEKNKRKRRRKKGKGGGSQNAAPTSSGDVSSETADQSPAVEVSGPPQPAPARQTRVKLDSEGVSKLAWKIFLAEVSEEGVALIGDSDAKELSRRCFRLAEIFMEEQARRG
jgi:hypothetical protein